MDEDPIVVRWPDPDDGAVRFGIGGGLAGRVAWSALLAHHEPQRGKFLLVAELRAEIVGVVAATTRRDQLYVEYLVRNMEARAAVGRPVAGALIDAAAALAADLGRPWLTLEALDDPRLLSLYEEKGFTRDGPPLFDVFWGTLHPMRKPVGGEPLPPRKGQTP